MSEEIAEVAKLFLNKNKIEHISIDAPKYEIAGMPPNDSKVNIWSVGYEYKVFDIESAYVEIEDGTKKILCVLTKHGRKYINGLPPEPVDDDGEDWN